MHNDFIEISVIASAARPQYWLEFYENISKNNLVPFEIVFVGPVEPDFNLPSNFRYYKSNVKISQCVEAAYRFSRGKYVFPIADDCLFCDGFLNKLHSHTMQNDMDKVIVIPRSARRWKVKIKSLYHRKNDKYPVVGLTSLMKKDTYISCGGIDNRFVNVYWHEDVHLRLYDRGYTPVVANDCIFNELDRGSYLTKTYGADDHKKLISLWSNARGEFVPKRQDEMKCFKDEGLLYYDQGDKRRM